VVAVIEEVASADDIEQFVARMIVQPPPPSPPTLNPDTDTVSESYHSHVSYTDNNDVIVTSADRSHVASDLHVNSAGSSAAGRRVSYPRAGCIDKTTDVYVNLPKRRPSDLPPRPPPPQLPLTSTHRCPYVNTNTPLTDVRQQTTANDSQWTFNQRALRWFDAFYDYQHSTSDDKTRRNVALCSANSLRPISLQQE